MSRLLYRAVLSRRTAPSGDPGTPAAPSVVPVTGSGGGNPGTGLTQSGPGSATPPSPSLLDLTMATAAANGGWAQSQPPAVPPAPGTFPPDPAAPVPTTPAAHSLTAQEYAQYQQVVTERHQLAAERQQILEWAERAKQQIAQMQRPAAPTPAPTDTNEFGIPKWDRSLERFLDTDAQGNIVERPGSPAGLAARYVDYRHKVAEFQNAFATNPESALAPILGKLNERARQEAEAAIQARQAQEATRQFVHENHGWMYARDQAGGTARDWQGNPVMTDAGKAFYQIATQLESQGVKDRGLILSLATQAVLGQRYMAMQQAQVQPAAPVQQSAAPQYPAMPVVPGAVLQDPRQQFLNGQAAHAAPAFPPAAPAAAGLPATPAYGMPSLMDLNQAYAPQFGVNLNNGWAG